MERITRKYLYSSKARLIYSLTICDVHVDLLLLYFGMRTIWFGGYSQTFCLWQPLTDDTALAALLGNATTIGGGGNGTQSLSLFYCSYNSPNFTCKRTCRCRHCPSEYGG